MQLKVSVCARNVFVLAFVAGFIVLPLAPSARVASVAASASRSGTLHVRKDCARNTGRAGSYCTIIMSNLDALKVGSRIVYRQAAAADGSLDSDIVIHVGPGTTVFGHCDVSATNHGLCMLSGGNGRFVHFRARETVAFVSGTVYSWDGPYSFGSPK